MGTEIGELKRIADRYATFAADEARGSSEIYERLALALFGASVAWPFAALAQDG